MLVFAIVLILLFICLGSLETILTYSVVAIKLVAEIVPMILLMPIYLVTRVYKWIV